LYERFAVAYPQLDGYQELTTRQTPPRHPHAPLAVTQATSFPSSEPLQVKAGDINAAAVAAYRASLQEGKPLSERKLAAAFGQDLTAVGARPDGRSRGFVRGFSRTKPPAAAPRRP
jgi:hypothetical protein